MAPKSATDAEQKAGKSKAEKKPVKAKAEKKPIKEGGKKKKAKKSTETYKIYIYKVLKQVRVMLLPSGMSALALYECLTEAVLGDSTMKLFWVFNLVVCLFVHDVVDV